MQANGDIQKEIRSQIGRAAAAFTSLNKIWLLKIYFLKAKSQQLLDQTMNLQLECYFHLNKWYKTWMSPRGTQAGNYAKWNENMKWNGVVTNVRSNQEAR